MCSQFIGKESLMSQIVVARVITEDTKRVLYTFWKWEILIPSELGKEDFEVVELEFDL